MGANVVSYEGNPQQLFDDVVNHLRKQGCKSLSEKEGFCRYRGKNGTSCAIGGIIPDELYFPGLENKTVHMICFPRDGEASYELSNVANLIGKSNQKLGDALQVVHDVKEITDWEDEFKRIANEFHLIYSQSKEIVVDLRTRCSTELWARDVWQKLFDIYRQNGGNLAKMDNLLCDHSTLIRKFAEYKDFTFYWHFWPEGNTFVYSYTELDYPCYRIRFIQKDEKVVITKMNTFETA